MGEIVNKQRLSAILGVSERALTDWQKQGMPVKEIAKKRGQSNKYDTEACIRWWILKETTASDETGTFEEERTRLTKAQADKVELDVAVMQGKLVLADEVERQFADRVLKCKSRLLGLPARMAKEVVTLTEVIEIEDKLKSVVKEALNELARPEHSNSGVDQSGDGVVCASA